MKHIKGVILTAGLGTRLRPITHVLNKNLIPVYDKPMVQHSIDILNKAGIADIIIISNRQHIEQFKKIIGDTYTYEFQEEPNGAADAIYQAKNFVGTDNFVVIFADNITDIELKEEVQNFKEGAKIFVKEVEDPKRFGVVDFDETDEVKSIEEKPENPKSNYAQTGVAIYDNKAFEYIQQLTPSERGELEFTDLNKTYLSKKKLKCGKINNWFDAGTFEGLFEAAKFIRDSKKNME